MNPKQLQGLYQVRFSTKEQLMRDKIWKILCREYLQKYIPPHSTCLDLAAGYCNFINNIRCAKKYAVDLNPDTKTYASSNVQVYNSDVTALPEQLKGKVDVVFAGCLLEHMQSKLQILQLFLETRKILKPGGVFIILNPNIRFTATEYWDYFDHHTPISDRSAAEGLELAGFEIVKILPRFVPNTVKDKLPKNPLLVKIYLKLPFLFPIFGRQMLIIARKPTTK